MEEAFPTPSSRHTPPSHHAAAPPRRHAAAPPRAAAPRLLRLVAGLRSRGGRACVELHNNLAFGAPESLDGARGALPAACDWSECSLAGALPASLFGGAWFAEIVVLDVSKNA
ncbi:MAG: hypothetical protein VX113_09735, partial [Pseudomonadota bacterium]|nr:hypothetical protein [Pseudomonadota bacterium]